jgi:hypothetical protein
VRAPLTVSIIGDGHARNFRRRDTGVKFNPTGFAAAALTFALSIALVYSAYGIVPSIFDGLLTVEEGEYHCFH